MHPDDNKAEIWIYNRGSPPIKHKMNCAAKFLSWNWQISENHSQRAWTETYHKIFPYSSSHFDINHVHISANSDRNHRTWYNSAGPQHLYFSDVVHIWNSVEWPITSGGSERNKGTVSCRRVWDDFQTRPGWAHWFQTVIPKTNVHCPNKVTCAFPSFRTWPV